ncbi:MAG: GWxTD domain-containing protein [Calditrichaeota bacterium]|nr:GWxTD domain-containing protein [Calditrichota bacterium]
MKLRQFRIFAALVLALMSFSAAGLSQTELQTGAPGVLPTFHWDVVGADAPRPELSRIYLYVKTPFDALTFVRADSGGFEASYEVSVTVDDKDGFQVDGKTWQEKVTADNFQATNSRRRFSVTHEKFDIAPGNYKLTLGFTDLETKRTKKTVRKIKLKNYSKWKLSVSDVSFVRNLEIDSVGVKTFVPEVADYIVDLSRKLFCYFEIYNTTQSAEDYQIDYVIKNSRNKKVVEHSYKRKSDGPRTLEAFPLISNNLSQGAYEIEVKVSQGKTKAKVKKRFIVRWADLPSSIYDIELAIKQVKYIAGKKEWDKLKKTHADEKLEAFRNFWARRDPTPGTPQNEWMDEYYERVAYANARFGGFRDGWKSDMGMIYIIFGAPSDVERHPFDPGSKPYEVWYYYTINKSFVFMDMTGFGEYRLLTQSWEDWRYLIRH